MFHLTGIITFNTAEYSICSFIPAIAIGWRKLLYFFGKYERIFLSRYFLNEAKWDLSIS